MEVSIGEDKRGVLVRPVWWNAVMDKEKERGQTGDEGD